MWGLDRLSGNPSPRSSTPSGSREYSPAPRRSLNVAQRSVSSRTPSTFLSRENSFSNITVGTRIIGSSSLKNRITSDIPEDAPDPIGALNKILGAPDNEKDALQSYAIDFKGLSLEDFVGDGAEDGSVESSDVSTYHSDESKSEYEKEHSQFEELHTSISSCEEVLRSVEEYLGSFQSDLGTVAAEIESLQSRSTKLNAMVESRRTVEAKLGPLVANATISPMTVKKIAEGALDEQFVIALEELRSKSKASLARNGTDTESKANQDLKPLLEDLSKRAVERIRDYFAARIKSMRAPNINAQLFQQQDFLRQRQSFSFLASEQPQLADDIMQAYSNTMRWYYASHFTRYQAALGKLKLHIFDRTDLLGEETNPRSQASSNRLPGHDAFNIGRRIDILRNTNANALPSSTAEESKIPTSLETPFASFNLAILDNASFEYTFLSTFLPATSPLSNPRSISGRFAAIFGPTIEMGASLSKTLIGESYDALGILLAVRLNQHFAFVAQRRKIPTLESYINGINLMLWPRFQVVMDAHCESLKRLTASLTSRTSGSTGGSAASAALATLSGGGAGGSASVVSTAPHPVTQRFASLLQGILTLSSEAGDDEPVSNSLARLRNDFDSFLAKMASNFGSGEKARRERERFLSNNYSLVLTIVADAQGRLAEECRAHFETLRGSSAAPA